MTGAGFHDYAGSVVVHSIGGVTFGGQLIGTVFAIVYGVVGGFITYKLFDIAFGIRLDEEDEFRGADLSVHSVVAYPEETINP